MFNRFTAAGSHAMSAAREEAISLGHNYLGTEHLLLGVLHNRFRRY
jgi:ATP-dependent Clp protease ATP-binding subunit ClpC